MIRSLLFLIATSLTSLAASATPEGWWNPAWTQRQTITIDAGPNAAAISEPIKDTTVLVRLHSGNFQFLAAAENGADLRFLNPKDNSVLPHHIERFDSMLSEAFVWVKIPEIKPGESTTLHLYYGAADPSSAAAANPAEAYDEATALALHFAQQGTAFQDGTRNANHSASPGTTSDGGIIGTGLRLLDTPLAIPPSQSLDWTAGQPLTWSAWIRPAALQENAVLFSKSSDTASFRLLLNQGVPSIQITNAGTTLSSPESAAVPATTWTHLAFIANGNSITLFVNGELRSTLEATLPALSAPSLLGGLASPAPSTSPFNGEIDSLFIFHAARSPQAVKFAAINQGASDASQRTLSLGENESSEAAGGHSEALQHVMLFGDIAKNMMFDGWIAVGVCILMIFAGWTVAIRKFLYLNSIEKGSNAFLTQWKSLSTDLTALDTGDSASIKSLGGTVDESTQSLIHKSPLFHIYQIGSDEIRHRLDKDNNRVQGLSGRSIQAIRASLDAGLVHETHRLTDGLVYLTISIAGGPYVGLLGTVVGVMITFAIIAKSGEVNVNSIAPGIASALLATVAGLVVAIPALFIYSYLNSRIKNSLALMQVFIDEFVAKMAEFYRPPNEPDPQAGKAAH